MRNQPRAMFNLFGAAVLATLLAACGSGGDSDTDTDIPAVIPLDVLRIECAVFDKVTNAAVGGAAVNYQASDKLYSTTSNADGSCRLDLPAADVAKVESPRGTVSKEGYEPQTLLVSACPSLKGGTACVLPVPLLQLAANISIPVGGDTVWHLGDEKFVASGVNTLFQKATDTVTLIDADASNDKPYLEFGVADWAAKVQAGGYTKATVTLDIKGMQTTICPNNAIALSGSSGTAALKGVDSPVDGSWERRSFEFLVADVGALSANARIVVTTGGECDLTNDFDDFEINRLRVEFSK
jgi:hypothetical protein